MKHLSPLLSLSLLFPLGNTARAQAPDFAHDLGTQVADVTRLEVAVEEPRLTAIAEVTGLDVAALADVPLYRGRVTRRGEEHDAILMQIPVGAPLDGCRVTIAVDRSGRTRGLGAWGDPEIDEDPSKRWGLFLHKLVEGAAGGDVDGELSKEGVMEKMRAFPDEQQPVLQGLLAQRMIMDWNDMIMLQNRLLADTDRNPDFAAAQTVARAMGGMSGRGKAFADFLGAEESGEYREFAAQLAERLQEYASLDPNMPRDEARQWVRENLKQSSCNECHRAKSAEGPDFRRALRTARLGLDVPRGVLLVGLDVAAALGDDGKRSQALATATRAGLLVAKDAWKIVASR